MDTGKTHMHRFMKKIINNKKSNASSLIRSREYSKALHGFLNRVMKLTQSLNGLNGM